MIDTIRSEWIKLRTVRMNYVLFIIAVAFPVIVCVLVASLGDITDLRVADVAGLVAGTSVITALLLGVVGAVSISSEFAYGTIRPTFAATPRRMRVLVAKAIVTALFALVAEALVVVICFTLSSTIATSRGATLSLNSDPEAKAALIGIVVFAVIVSLLGFGLGMVIRNTPAAVAILILWPLVAENIVFVILNAAGVSRPRRFLPYTSGFGLASTDVTNHEGLSRIAGGVYFAVVTAAVACLGAFITARRDA
jgi:ABC-2 type transport system permease protein